jgi:hypothetical protein
MIDVNKLLEARLILQDEFDKNNNSDPQGSFHNGFVLNYIMIQIDDFIKELEENNQC